MVNDRTKVITKIINSLSSWSRKENSAAIEPSMHVQDDNNVQLDILARTLTRSKDTCIALCLWKKKLLVAGNRKVVDKSVIENLVKLRNFIRFGKNKLELLKEALERSCEIIEKGQLETVLREASLTEEEKNNLNEFENLSVKQRKVPDEKKIVCLVEKLFELSKKFRRSGKISLSNKIWDLISPIEDSNKMMKLVIESKLNPLLLDAIMNNSIISISSEDNIHAEMKIIDYIFSSAEQTEKGYFYIGIGKLCCLPCQKVIDVINEFYQWQIGCPGTHGKCYSWKLLKSFWNSCDGEYEIFKNALTRINNKEYSPQVRESTCCFPERLTSFDVEELVFAQQAQISK